jgi:hypothetical protein
MTQNDINGSGGISQNGVPTVSVSEDGITFITLTPTTPYYPTNPYYWSGTSTANPSGWEDSQLQDFTKPVNPDLTANDFAGQSVAYAADTLYDGSAGGAAFSLKGTGLTEIQYIRFTGTGGSSVVDAVSAVGFDPAAAPEPSALLIFAIGIGGLVMYRVLCARKRA